MRRLLASLAAVVVAAFAAPAQAEIRALIVAVSQYTAPIPSLEGPPNDAAALKAVLAEQGAKDIVSIQDAQFRSAQGPGGDGHVDEAQHGIDGPAAQQETRVGHHAPQDRPHAGDLFRLGSAHARPLCSLPGPRGPARLNYP